MRFYINLPLFISVFIFIKIVIVRYFGCLENMDSGREKKRKWFGVIVNSIIVSSGSDKHKIIKCIV